MQCVFFYVCICDIIICVITGVRVYEIGVFVCVLVPSTTLCASLAIGVGLCIFVDGGRSTFNIWLLENGWWWDTCNECSCGGDWKVTGKIVK